MKITFEKETKMVLEVEDAATVTFVETPESTAIMVNNHSDSWLKKMYHFLKGVLKVASRRKAQRRWIVGFDKARAEKL